MLLKPFKFYNEKRKKWKTNSSLNDVTIKLFIHLSCFFKILWNPVKFIFTYFSNLINRNLKEWKLRKREVEICGNGKKVVEKRRKGGKSWSDKVIKYWYWKKQNENLQAYYKWNQWHTWIAEMKIKQRAYFRKSSPQRSILVLNTSIEADLSALMNRR